MLFCLKDMKKLEDCEFLVNSMKYFKYGDDYKWVKSAMKKKGLTLTPETKLKFIVILYSYTTNTNTFTMTLDEKILNANRKKDIASKMIKQKAYKRAERTLKCCKELLQYVVFLVL